MVMEIITARIALFNQQARPEKKLKKRKPHHNVDKDQEEHREVTWKHNEDIVEISDKAYEAQQLSLIDNT